MSSALSLKLLQHHLTHTTISRDDSGIPFAHPTTLFSSSSSSTPRSSPPAWNYAPAASSDPLNFASFVPLFATADTSSLSPIFRLGSALFDPIDLHLNRSRAESGTTGETLITPDIRNRVQMLRRKKALSKWLGEVVKPSVDSDLRTQVNGSNGDNPSLIYLTNLIITFISVVAYTPADAAFTHLTGHQVSEACSTAADGGYLKLSTLISQAGGDDLYKNDIIAQLDIWKNEKLAPGSNPGLGNPQNGLVGRSVWKVYNLLGGLLTEGPEGTSEDILCAGLDWKRTFGLCLWYGTSVDSSVADAVNTYEHVLSEGVQNLSSNQIAQPIPKWAIGKKKFLTPSPTSSRFGLFTSSLIQAPDDPLFALIKLCADPTLSLSKALNPLSFAPSGLDWGIGMCWHLYIILSRIMRVRDFADRSYPGAKFKGRPPGNLTNGFEGSGGREHSSTSSSDVSKDEDDEGPSEGHSPTADLLTSSYAFELESWGMIQEAAFVLLHLEGSVGYVLSRPLVNVALYLYWDHLIGAKRLSKTS